MITELSVGNESLAQLTHINNVFGTYEPPSCAFTEPWRLGESASELEKN